MVWCYTPIWCGEDEVWNYGLVWDVDRMLVESACMCKRAKTGNGLAAEEVRLLDDRPRLCGTILQSVLERYDVSGRFLVNASRQRRCHAPSTYLMNDLVYSTGGVIGTPPSSTALVRFMVATIFDMIKKMFDSANAFPGHTLRPNPNTESTR